MCVDHCNFASLALLFVYNSSAAIRFSLGFGHYSSRDLCDALIGDSSLERVSLGVLSAKASRNGGKRGTRTFVQLIDGFLIPVDSFFSVFMCL